MAAAPTDTCYLLSTANPPTPAGSKGERAREEEFTTTTSTTITSTPTTTTTTTPTRRECLGAILMFFRLVLTWCFPIRALPFEQKE